MSDFPNFHQVKSVRFLLACKLITYELTLEPINDWHGANVIEKARKSKSAVNLL